MKAIIILLLAVGGVPVFASQTISNPQPIQLPEKGVAGLYPSTISVSGFTGLVLNVSVTLSNVSHESLADVTALLVGPQGRTVQIFSLVGTSPDGGRLNGGWSVRIESGFALALTRVCEMVKITWPQSAQGYQLQSSPRLGLPEWTTVTTPVVPDGSNFSVQEPPATSARFYRLLKP